MRNEFTGRIVCVTGGTGALGGAVVEQLSSSGAQCYIPSRREASEPSSNGARTIGGVDLTSEESVRRFYSAVSQDGPIWASIHLAGTFAAAPVLETSAALMMEQFQANTLSSFLCCREAICRMRQTGVGGRIVNVVARPALEPRMGAGMSAYTASKAALAALTQSLSEETANDSIWVNAVAPSIIDTPANRRAQPEADFSRWPKPEEIASTIIFLASPANFTTRGCVATVYGST